ncbi:MAG: hypothetical protein LBQ45_00385 [Mycoplasmataceae bacterium]|jgi:hypothetical protein|nr:hypothetical protein [Mycoplasmataceae bacterium]
MAETKNKLIIDEEEVNTDEDDIIVPADTEDDDFEDDEDDDSENDEDDVYIKISNVETKRKNEPQTEFYIKGTTPINGGSSYLTPYKFVFKKGSLHHAHVSKNQFGKEGCDADAEYELGNYINNFLKETYGTKANKNFNLDNLKMVMDDENGDITAEGVLEHSK